MSEVFGFARGRVADFASLWMMAADFASLHPPYRMGGAFRLRLHAPYGGFRRLPGAKPALVKASFRQKGT